MKQISNKKLAYKVSIITIICNFLLMIFKFIAGILTHSIATISDAVHTGSDVLSTFVVMFGVKISNKKSDKNHEFGHERFECVAAIILSIMLCATGLSIGYVGINKIIIQNYGALTIGTLALVSAVISIVVKEAMYWYTIRAAKKINSSALSADAWHHRSDALSSVGSLVGVVGAMLGVPILDAIASIVICLFIVKASILIFVDAIRKMTDEACDEETENKIFNVIVKIDGVLKIDNLKTRKFGDKVFVEVDICANENLTLIDAHKIAENVEIETKNNFYFVKDCFVHVNPCKAKKET